MRYLRSASFDEFVRWYLVRERQKGGRNTDLNGVPPDALRKEMRQVHPDKLRRWFEQGKWGIVMLDSVAEAVSLVCVDSAEVRQNGLVSDHGPDQFLAASFLAHARDCCYFDNPHVCATNSVEWHYRQERLETFRRDWPKLQGERRITICSLNADERTANPRGTWYLHDGMGRLLPWLYCVIYEGFPYYPIEAFCAEDGTR